METPARAGPSRCEDPLDVKYGDELAAHIESSSDLAWKFNIPAEEKWKVLSHLDEHNLNGYTLFGTEDELMKTLVMRPEIQRWRDGARSGFVR